MKDEQSTHCFYGKQALFPNFEDQPVFKCQKHSVSKPEKYTGLSLLM
jgi:hypothetical protein